MNSSHPPLPSEPKRSVAPNRLSARKAQLLRWGGATYQRLASSRFTRNSLWLTGLAGVERIAGVAQTVLVARALGITEYGVYGLLMGTIGLVASIVGMQMGLTGAVFVARYRETEKAKAALVIQYVTRFAWIVAGSITLVTLPFATPVSSWLLLSDQYGFAVVVGCFYIGAALMSGVQDGVLQGFEEFQAIARVRIVTTLLTLAAIYPAAKYAGLTGIMAVLIAGLVVSFVLFRLLTRRLKRQQGIPKRGEGLRFADVILKFSLPSVLINLLVGAVTWYGTFLLSRQSGGFEDLAIVNTGLQWRGPVLLVASSMGSVAIPTFSRYAAQENDAASSNLRRILLRVNGAAALGVSTALILLSTSLLALYGSEFVGGRLVFCMVVASTVPQVLVNVYMQSLLGRGLLWRALLLHGPVLVVSLVGYVVLVPRYAAIGFAGTTLVSAIAFWLFLVYFVQRDARGVPQR
ncbi:MAG TPA: oligosaccharide flippase family protein [Myxococcota bacterium]|jgi:O-antigen/teichoic acid export membrane protein